MLRSVLKDCLKSVYFKTKQPLHKLASIFSEIKQMKIFFIILLILAFSCSKSKTADDYFKEKILGETFDTKGRLVKKVVTGRIPGEDIYLTITKYDTLERITTEYGARPYGKKFKTIFKYNSETQLIETLDYAFPNIEHGEFENYKSDGLYELSDTLVDFVGIVDKKTLFEYDNRKDLVIERYYSLDLDSVTNTKNFRLFRIDTVASEKKATNKVHN